MTLSTSPDDNENLNDNDDQNNVWTFQIWSVDTWTLKFAFNDQGPILHAIELNNDLIACTSRDKIRIWNYRTGLLARSVQSNRFEFRFLVFLQDGNIAGCESRPEKKPRFGIWNPNHGELLHESDCNCKWILCSVLLPDGNLAIGGEKPCVQIFNINSRQFERTLVEQYTAYELKMLSENRLAVCEDYCIQIIRLTGERERTIFGIFQSITLLNNSYFSTIDSSAVGAEPCQHQKIQLWSIDENDQCSKSIAIPSHTHFESLVCLKNSN
jgi:hypothetical protein